MACAAEHNVYEPVIGVALDGAGLGTDGAIRGGEVLVATPRSFVRAGHLAYVRQPGGDRAAREPFRMALAYLVHTFGDRLDAHLPVPLRGLDAQRLANLRKLIQSGVCAPSTSSCGRLFDGVASICGLQQTSRFEAQAAMALEACAEASDTLPPYPVNVDTQDGVVPLDPAMFIRPIVADLEQGVAVPRVARRFHRTVAVAFAEACLAVQRIHGPRFGPLNVVALAGGCFVNRVLLEDLSAELIVRGFAPIACERVPSNDGGLSLGQAVVVASQLTGDAGPRALPFHLPENEGAP